MLNGTHGPNQFFVSAYYLCVCFHVIKCALMLFRAYFRLVSNILSTQYVFRYCSDHVRVSFRFYLSILMAFEYSQHMAGCLFDFLISICFLIFLPASLPTYLPAC